MTNERAIEILNPEHREHYPSIEPVNEACRMGMEALEYRIPKRPEIVKKENFIQGYRTNDAYYTCPSCNGIIGMVKFVDKGEIKKPNHCDPCGQALDWT